MSQIVEKHLGRKIRLGRKRAGLTQEELAARVFLTPESISNIERSLKEPGIKTLRSLAKALGVPLSELLDQSEESGLSPERLRLEFQLRDLARQLGDRDLTVVVKQIEIMLLLK
jgi:transcriptional regulator with XRE-family HTH domain